MAQRNAIPLDLIWVLVDMTHGRATDVLAAAEAKLAQRIPGATMSVNQNIAGTQALVKVTDTALNFRGNLPAPVRAAIIRTFIEADHAEALAMVTTLEWTGPLEGPEGPV